MVLPRFAVFSNFRYSLSKKQLSDISLLRNDFHNKFRPCHSNNKSNSFININKVIKTNTSLRSNTNDLNLLFNQNNFYTQNLFVKCLSYLNIVGHHYNKIIDKINLQQLSLYVSANSFGNLRLVSEDSKNHFELDTVDYLKLQEVFPNLIDSANIKQNLSSFAYKLPFLNNMYEFFKIYQLNNSKLNNYSNVGFNHILKNIKGLYENINTITEFNSKIVQRIEDIKFIKNVISVTSGKNMLIENQNLVSQKSYNKDIYTKISNNNYTLINSNILYLSRPRLSRPARFEKFYKSPGRNPGWNNISPAIVLSIMLYSLIKYISSGSETKEISFKTFVYDFLIPSRVLKIDIVNRDYAVIYVKPSGPITTDTIIPDISLDNDGSFESGTHTIQKASSYSITPFMESEDIKPINDNTEMDIVSGISQYVVRFSSCEWFESRLEAVQKSLGYNFQKYIPVRYVQNTSGNTSLGEIAKSMIVPIFSLLPFLFAWRVLKSLPTSPGAGGPMSMGKINAKVTNSKSSVKFADIAGVEQAKAEVMEFVDFLRHPKKYEKVGAVLPKGCLLVGPPGTGKTLLAKAVAGEAQVPFFSLSGSDFIEMFVGVGPSRVRDLFEQAKKASPSIVFIDEIDAVGRKRGKAGFGGGASDERENTLNQLLVEMDGFKTHTNVVVLAGTNRVDILDEALIRPGRFDRQVHVDKPDLAERAAIFDIYLAKVKLDGNQKEIRSRLAALTPGFVGADIRNIVNEAAIYAARRNSETVSLKDFELANDRVMGGLPKNSIMSPSIRSRVSIHESGHAVAGWFLEHADPLLKVSIVPRSGGALGFAQYLPEEAQLYHKEALLDRICVTLAGRAAEQIFTNTVSTGASDDLQKVANLAYSMVTKFGMVPDGGILGYSLDPNSIQKPYSEKSSREFDMLARKIVDEQYDRAVKLINDKKDLVSKLSDILLEKETIDVTVLNSTLGKRPFKTNSALDRYNEGQMKNNLA